MQKAIGNLLDLKSVPDSKVKLTSIGSNVRLPQLKFMRQLFESPNSQTILGSTIRSFRPVITSLPPCEGLHGLDFNLNSLKPTDILLSAEVHYENRLKLDSYKLAGFKDPYTKEYQLEVVKSCGQAVFRQAHSTFENQWTSFDLKDAVDEMMQKNSTHFFLRCVKYAINGPAYSTRPTTDLQRSKREVGLAPSEPLSHHRRHYQSRKVARQVGTPYYYSYDIRMSNSQQPKLKAQFQTFKTIGPRMLTSRKQKNRSRRPKIRHDPADPMMGFGRMDDNKETAKSNLLPFPTKLKVEETSDEVREFNVNTDDRIQGNDVTLVLLDQQKEKQTIARKKCQKRSLKINFRDIGWTSG
uniref:Uncharacterized protein n=1 Tax=Ditylenchus dipsaci TaxID=166011 RepID=A0A915CQP0_9BILA